MSAAGQQPRTVAEAMIWSVRKLQAAGIEDAGRDARRLMAHALQEPADRMSLHQYDVLDEEAEARLAKAVDARQKRQPVSQIIGQRAFYGRTFKVTRAVLDPRPETETLIETALEADFQTVLDLGTGSGCILLTLLAERTEAEGIGVDVSPGALSVAQYNAESLGLRGRSDFLLSDWFTDVEGTFDLIVSNPPYITEEEMAELSPDVIDWEPRLALTTGGDGLSAYRAIAAALPQHLAPGGRFLCEIGPAQAVDVGKILSDTRIGRPEVFRDLDGRPRVLSLRSEQ